MARFGQPGAIRGSKAAMTETTYIPLTEVERRTGLPRRTLARRLANGDIPTYVDGRDHRRRVIAVSDLPALTSPKPVSRRSERAEPMPAA